MTKNNQNNTMTQSVDLKDIVLNDRAQCLLEAFRAQPELLEDALELISDHNAQACALLVVGLASPANLQYQFKKATFMGSKHVVKIYAPYVDATENRSVALQLACMFGWDEIAEFLYPLSNPYEAVTQLVGEPNRKLQDMIDHHTALEQRQRMLKQIHSPGHKNKKKI